MPVKSSAHTGECCPSGFQSMEAGPSDFFGETPLYLEIFWLSQSLQKSLLVSWGKMKDGGFQHSVW